MLTAQQRSARARVARQVKVARLCTRLDRHVIAAEKFKRGATKAAHLAAAEQTRQELRAIDH